MIFALVNESTHPELTRPRMLEWAEAFAVQLARDFASMWQTLPADVLVCDALAEVPGDACIVHFVDRIPEAPDALAYHTRDRKNRPVARIGVFTSIDNGGSIDDVSESASHEILEAWEDPYITSWLDFDGKKKVADEVCDPVQGSPYKIGSVTVANFTGSRWRDPGGAGPYDFRGVLKKPLSRLPTGYLAFDDGSQISAKRCPSTRRRRRPRSAAAAQRKRRPHRERPARSFHGPDSRRESPGVERLASAHAPRPRHCRARGDRGGRPLPNIRKVKLDMTEKLEIPPAPPTVPAHALAIDRLTNSVENMRSEMAAQGALANRERTTVLDHLARFDHALKTVVHDLQQVKSTVINAVERLEKVEAVVFQKLRLTALKPERKRRAAKKR